MRTVIFVANDYEAENIFSLKEFSIVENEPFKTWKHSTKNIYVVITGIGKTNAGAAAQWALLKFDPDHCINLGLVGGLNTELKIGEVMQVSACAFHE
ncbi:5'-methylthioadenosine/S-adenosylhomocysteine nucleosidase, partial [Candidatus Roizmanbacteria bacterium]|nr:5'-methylthioadenosine/S-adenosylhomocysteine nucleosidase [Candidatus Roizmanbacteria bacterium]